VHPQEPPRQFALSVNERLDNFIVNVQGGFKVQFGLTQEKPHTNAEVKCVPALSSTKEGNHYGTG
jgi:hypothetical protein